MPPKDQGMAVLREVAHDVTTGAREEPAVPCGLMNMPLSDAFACARADLRNARRALEVQLALAMEDEPKDRARRVGIIQTYLADLTESEARLDATERTLAAKNAKAFHGKS
jgi:hypothetical protein